ncbi:myb-like protein D [Vespula squamosa]|uniref:Myb-like protein D n=1 Tax=Vespula squamosa TaxID=30214 RepID=A0ABD2A1D2_VESSQ
MNAFSENPFFFFVDNAHPIFPMDVYQDVGKIIELSDTGCDAISPSSTRQKKDQNREKDQYCEKKTPRHNSAPKNIRKIFDEKQETNKEEFQKKSNTRGNVLSADKTSPRKIKTKEFLKERSKTIDRENNEKIEQWERNIADFESILKGQGNFIGDLSSNEVIDDSDLSDYLLKKAINRKNQRKENDTRKKVFDPYKNSNESTSTTKLSQSRDGSNDLENNNNKRKRIFSTTRSAQKKKENSSKPEFNDVTDDTKVRTDFSFVTNVNERNNEVLKDLDKEIKKSIDRAVDIDSISDMFENLDGNLTKKIENINQEKNSTLKKQENVENFENDFNRQDVDHEMNNKTLSERKKGASKSADLDRMKYRENMTKRNVNKSSTDGNNSATTKIQDNESFIEKESFHNKNNKTKSRVLPKSAGSVSRRKEDIQKEKIESKKEINMAFSFDDNSDASKKLKKNVKERSSDTNPISGYSFSKSVKEDRESNKAGIQRKDLENIGAIFLSSAMKKSKRWSKTIDNEDKNLTSNNDPQNTSDQLEENKIEEDNSDRPPSFAKFHSTISNLLKLSDKTEKSIRSRIPIAISRLKKELGDNCNISNLENRRRSRSKSKVIIRETNRLKDNKIDESTSTALILVDKSDCTRDNDNEENDQEKSRQNSSNRKFEGARKKKMDVELKVFKMAKAEKEERRKEFEKCGLREPGKKLKNRSQEMIDIAVTILERKSEGVKTSDGTNSDGKHLENVHADHEGYSKPYSLRSGIYTRYFPNFSSKSYRT